MVTKNGPQNQAIGHKKFDNDLVAIRNINVRIPLGLH